MVETSLSSLLFGVLTVLSLTAIYFLVRQGSFARTNTKVLVLGTLLLYLSTGTYVAALMWNRWQAHYLVLGATNRGFSPSYDGYREMAVYEEAVRKQTWMVVIALEVNCVIGDAIVWWRACVIWRNRVVYGIGPLLVSLTVVFGFIGYHEPQIIPTTGVALLDTDNAFVKAAAIASLVTNALATALIAYKAWKHRRLVKKQFSSAGTKSRVLNALALLVESGSVYCALLIFVVFYETDPVPSQGDAGLIFARVAAGFVYGCLPPLVAIYPTIIIVLVALKRSPIDTGGLSRIYHQAHDHGAGPGQGDNEARHATIVFHHSTFCTSASEDTDDAIPDGLTVRSRQSSSSEPAGHAKDVGKVV